MERIEFGFFDAGGGHRAAATALSQAISGQERPWDVRLTNLQEVLDPADVLRKYAHIRIQDFYNWMLRSGCTLGSSYLIKMLQLTIATHRRKILRLLCEHWSETKPELFVSLVPHFNRELSESFHRVFPGRPYVTVMTDIADYPPHFWLERQTVASTQPQYVVCGSNRAMEQATFLGYSAEQIFRASGMILNPRFYEAPLADRAVERERLGLDPALPTALVLFGGHGSKAMMDIVERLDESAFAMQMILICGKNNELAKSLRERKTRMPIFVEGFTKEIPYYMDLADFFIGKPGPGSISEALAKNLPVIVGANAWTLPQERYNARWIREQGVGLAISDYKQIVGAVEELLAPERYAMLRENARRIKNNAVFEIPYFLNRVLHQECEVPTTNPASTPQFAHAWS
jgi:hypothetical protein